MPAFRHIALNLPWLRLWRSSDYRWTVIKSTLLSMNMLLIRNMIVS